MATRAVIENGIQKLFYDNGDGTLSEVPAPLQPSNNVIGITDTADLDVVGSSSSASVLFTQDVSNFGSVGVQTTAFASGSTIIFEGSNDNSNWVPVIGANGANGTASAGTSVSTGLGLLVFPTVGIKYFRARVSVYGGSGTNTVAARFKKQPVDLQWVATPVTALGQSSASGGLSLIARLLSAAASTNSTLVKSSAGRVYKVRGYNAAAAVRYLKLYNKASAPTVGTDTPLITIALKPSDVFDFDLADIGFYFSTGISYSITTGSADSDTGALTAGDVVGLNVIYT